MRNLKRVSIDTLERLAFESPGACIEVDGDTAYLSVRGVIYMAEFNVETEVA